MRKNVIRLLTAITCALVFTIVPAFANAVPAPCPDGGNLSAFLVAGYSCTIGDKIFSNFSYTSSASGSAIAAPASAVTVDTMGPSGSGASILSSDIGLQFNSADWTATGAGSATDSGIGFTVSVINGGPLRIEDAGVVQVGGIFSTGSASVAELGCSGVGCKLAQWDVFTFDNSSASASDSAAETFFSPTGSVTVLKDINVSAGANANGFASLSIVQDTFSQIPEPRQVSLLLGVGLLAGLAFRKKLQSARG